MCKIDEVVVMGGVRRSAMISLSNLSDIRMRHAKSGDWYNNAPHMALANNSVVYTDKPDGATFLREWTSLVESKSGERGIFNRIVHKSKLRRMEDDLLTTILVVIHALRLYCVHTSSVTSLRW